MTRVRRFMGFVALAGGLASLAVPGAHSAEPAFAPSWQDCDVCPRLRAVPVGSFLRGSDEGEPGRPEGPVREVRIDRPFALGVHEVTVAQFAAFVAATGYAVAAGCRTLAASSSAEAASPRGWAFDPTRHWRAPGLSGDVQPDHPVVCVGRVDALAYVAWLSARTGERYRLPTESEWEYAARAGSAGRFPWGGEAAQGCGVANLYDRSGRARHDFGWEIADCDDGHAELAPVGSLAANAFGLHDLIGNVWEWTADCYRETYDDAPIDGSAVTGDPDCARWSVRGGSWMTRPSRNRVTFRGRDPNDARYAYFGFRVARELRP